MKLSVKAVVVAVACCGVFFASSAQINLRSNGITFRTYSTAAHQTDHYGDLYLSGGSSGSSWGWLTCTRIICNGQSQIAGPIFIWDNLSVTGTKNFIQPHPTDTTKIIKYIAIEAGEAMTMARGCSRTSGGSVDIALPEHFGLVTSNDVPLTVLLTPEESPVLLYTAKKSREQITVVMKPSDFREFGDAAFAWQVSGVREGYENEETIVNIDAFASGSDSLVTVSEKRAAINARAKRMMEKCNEVAKKKDVSESRVK